MQMAYADFDGCRLGMTTVGGRSIKKPWRVCTDDVEIVEALDNFKCKGDCHHVWCAGKHTAGTAQYPRLMCRFVHEAWIKSTRKGDEHHATRLKANLLKAVGVSESSPSVNSKAEGSDICEAVETPDSGGSRSSKDLAPGISPGKRPRRESEDSDGVPDLCGEDSDGPPGRRYCVVRHQMRAIRTCCLEGVVHAHVKCWRLRPGRLSTSSITTTKILIASFAMTARLHGCLLVDTKISMMKKEQC